MTDQECPTGELFTHAYVQRGKPTEDSPVLRRRLAAYVVYELGRYGESLCHYLRKESGLEVPYIGSRSLTNVQTFFDTIPIPSLLNLITLIWRHLHPYQDRYKNPAGDWKRFVSRVFREENIGYALDDRCGVHFLVDEEFEHNRMSVLRSLDEPRYANVRDAFESAHSYLDLENQDTKAAVRSMFESLEILTKLMVDTKNLNRWVVENEMKKLAHDVYVGDDIANAALDKVFDGFAQWVDGLHMYRHGQPKTDPVSPPLGFAIYVVSTGAAMLRFLVEIDGTLRLRDGAE